MNAPRSAARVSWLIAAALCALAAAGCVSKLAYGEVKGALVDAGLSDANAACMARRMTDRLSIAQLRKLKRLKGANRSIADFVSAVRDVDDREAIEVTLAAAARCAAGLAIR